MKNVKGNQRKKTVQDTENASFRIQGTAGHIRHRGSAPGIITVNMAIYVGNTQAELAGAACVTLGVVLPALLLLFLFGSLPGRGLRSLTALRYRLRFD